MLLEQKKHMACHAEKKAEDGNKKFTKYNSTARTSNN